MVHDEVEVTTEKMVTTYKGERANRSDCKKLRGEYYIKNKDCFEVDGLWLRVSSGLIIFDHASQKWLLKSKAKNMAHGIVDFDNVKGTPVLGYFATNPSKNVDVIDAGYGKAFKCINSDLAKSFCVEDVSTGKFYFNVSMSQKEQFKVIKNVIDNRNKGYNIEDNADELALKIKVYKEYQTPVNKYVARFAALLQDLTFGAEIECIKGYLPDYLQYQTGTIICRDGSLHAEDGTQGPEFTTIPLQHAKGVQSLIDLCNGLTNRTIVDKHCSFHLHLGNLPTSRVFLVALHRLAYMIQDEVFSMFPYYKNDERRYADKDKNYCQKLNRLSIFSLKNFEKESYKYYINDNYTRIFTFLSGGVVPCKQYNRTSGQHPKAGEKWNKAARYRWLNFMNCIFSKRNTVEFRIHTGTTNAQKVITWLFICNAIVKTAMNKAGDILQGNKLTLDDVLDYYKNTFKTTIGDIMSNYLKEYVRYRKEYFLKDYKMGDFLSERELLEDKKFNFEYQGISEIFKSSKS